MLRKTLMRLSIVAAIAGGTILGGTAERAEALPGWRSTFLGQLGTSDNAAYYRSQRRMELPTPPWDRNALCIWKYGNPSQGQIKGYAASWFGSGNWKTNCYKEVWQWW